MSFNKSIKCGWFAIAVLLLFAACKKDQKTNWGTENLVPLLSTNLSLQNLVKDSTIRANADSSLTLAFKTTLYELNLADKVVNIPDTSIGQKFTLDSLGLPSQRIIFNATLGFIANNMLQNPNTANLGQLIITENHGSMAIPALSGFDPGSFPFNGGQYFDSAYLTGGQVDIVISNGLPIDILGGTLVIKNADDNSVVASQNMFPIPAHSLSYLVIPVGAVRITSNLVFGVTNLSTAATNGNVPIDLDSALQLNIHISQLKVSEAWAKFPTQNVVDQTGDLAVNLGDRKLTYIDARSGFLHIYITNSIPQPLYLEYTLVGAYDQYGHPLKEFTTVPAAPPGGHSQIDTSINVAGFAINLTGKDGSQFNTYTQRIVARIDSTGQTQHITKSDSLNIRYELVHIAPNYIKGYIGKDTASVSDTSGFSFLNMFKSGTIDLQSVSMNLSVENGIGVDGVVKINNLTAMSQNNPIGLPLQAPSVVGQNLVVHRATDFPLTPAISNFALNNNNSNIKNLLGMLPNKIKYDVFVQTNPNGNNQQYRDFAYLESSLKINLDAEIPLSLIANHLLLKDTIPFDLSTTNTNINGVSDGVLNLIAENKFPINAILTMVVYDDNWVPVDTLVSNTEVLAADLNSSCRATQIKRTKAPIYVSQERLTNIKRAKHAIVTADFSTISSNTTCNGQHLKIYSDYNLGITFTAKFNYKVGIKF